MMLGTSDGNGNTAAELVLIETNQELFMFILFLSRKERTLKCTANTRVLSNRKMSITWEL
jgi:hypothetical protein